MILRFIRSRNVLMLAMLALVACDISLTWQYALGFAVGVLAYRLLETKFHRDMHESRWSPFRGAHKEHHDNPTPETGCPHYWVFAMYFAIDTGVSLISRPGLSGLWAGIFAMLFAYEVVHFVCHCRYRPRTEWGWRVRVNHLLHHRLDDSTRYELLFPKRASK
jgi:hypothetical protein